IPLDDGHYHGSFQDLNIRVRYNAWTHPFMITPFVEYITPTNGYMFYSHAIVGNHVRQLNVGVFLGSLIDRVLPNTYIHGRYSYGFPQEILGVSRTRQNGEFEMGYFFTPSIHAFGLLIGQVTNGGIDVPEDIPVTERVASNPVFFHHAQITRDNILDIAGGVG